ncbi:DUF986 family protein [Xenorhabdus sp. KJ12.1]|uniref:DUF986 family protein n=1 Tax=Xenorhabdus sp. KJ12.1 TaxID=1851571 RepID=UPI000C04D9A9|nr:DUF986 family protein [Xenorhabdus sp. KJ12.1]PHM72956.1 hypothetical protein Xekj_00167 [Xenorhabdus sp. KJ12.1]
MSLNDIILIASILLAFAFAIYDEFFIHYFKDKTLLTIKLKRKHRIDALIFIILVSIVIYNNIASQGSPLTTYLLSFIILISIYFGYIRSPKIIFKKEGFYYFNRLFYYEKIKAINLSEDGILMIDFEVNKIYIAVTKLDDLEKIYKFLLSNK